jgi:tetratricopeptide (TPR) repeat protein
MRLPLDSVEYNDSGFLIFRILFRVVLMPWGHRVKALSAFLLSLCLGVVSAQTRPSNDRARDRAILEIQATIESGNLPAAREQLTASTKELGSDAGFDNLSGVIEAQEHHYSAAEAEFKRAIERQPRFTAAYLNLARLYQESFSRDSQANTEAVAVYDVVLSYEPGNPEANYQSALLLMEAGKYQASLTHVSRLPKTARESAQVLSILCADYVALRDHKSTSTVLAQLLESSDFSEADVRQVMLGIKPGTHEDVTIALLEALEKRQQLPADLEHNLGLAYAEVGKLDEARSILEKFAVEHLSVPSLFDVARVAYKQRDYRGSLGYLAHARDLEPDNPSVHYSFGVVCLDLDLIAEAQKSFEKAVKLDPENSSYNYAMGAIALFSHDPEIAVPYFKQYLKHNPTDPRGKLAVGIAFFRAKDYDEAAPWFDQAAKEAVTATSAHYYLGSLALRMGRVDEALPQLQSALRAKPDYADALAELGRYYFVRRNYDEAEKQLQQALKRNPDHMAANFYLLSLYTRTRDPRAAAQYKHYDELQKLRDTKLQDFLRMVEVRPFETP